MITRFLESDLNGLQDQYLRKADRMFLAAEGTNDPEVTRDALMAAWDAIHSMVHETYLFQITEQNQGGAR